MCWQKDQPLEKEKSQECTAPFCEYRHESHPGYFYVRSAFSLRFRLNCVFSFPRQSKRVFKLPTT